MARSEEVKCVPGYAGLRDKSPDTNVRSSLRRRPRCVLGNEACEVVDRVSVFRVLPDVVVQVIGDVAEGDPLLASQLPEEVDPAGSNRGRDPLGVAVITARHIR